MKGNKTNHPKKYLTVKRFEVFLSNDFWHLKVKVAAIMWLTLTILAVLIGTLVVRFLLG